MIRRRPGFFHVHLGDRDSVGDGQRVHAAADSTLDAWYFGPDPLSGSSRRGGLVPSIGPCPGTPYPLLWITIIARSCKRMVYSQRRRSYKHRQHAWAMNKESI